jgi:hypothetical protein
MNLAQHIVPGWWRKYTVWLSTIALILPDLLQWALDNLDFLGMVGKLDDATKAHARMVILALIPLAAMVKQKSIPPKDANEGKPL